MSNELREFNFTKIKKDNFVGNNNPQKDSKEETKKSKPKKTKRAEKAENSDAFQSGKKPKKTPKSSKKTKKEILEENETVNNFLQNNLMVIDREDIFEETKKVEDDKKKTKKVSKTTNKTENDSNKVEKEPKKKRGRPSKKTMAQKQIEIAKNDISSSVIHEQSLGNFSNDFFINEEKPKRVEKEETVINAQNLNDFILQAVEIYSSSKICPNKENKNEIKEIKSKALQGYFSELKHMSDYTLYTYKAKMYESEIEKWESIGNDLNGEIEKIIQTIEINSKERKNASDNFINENTKEEELCAPLKKLQEANKKLIEELKHKSDQIAWNEDKMVNKFKQVESQLKKMMKNIYIGTEERINPILFLKAMAHFNYQ